MDNNEYRTFKILDEIGQDVNISQRHLADKLDISLGLVNSFIKRLVMKGYFKAVSIQKNRVRYILTPEGVSEKTRLTYNYIKHSYELYKTSHNKIQEIFNNLEICGVKSVFFYGATDIAEIAYISLKGTDIRLSGVIDDEKAGELFLNYKITNIGNTKISPSEKIIITANDFLSLSINSLVGNGVENNQIVTFD